MKMGTSYIDSTLVALGAGSILIPDNSLLSYLSKSN